ncbi:MAG: ribosome small subunit-dependent GTPase A [Parachlamydiales bacterium]|jgi:ribosome biogenesis GTPase
MKNFKNRNFDKYLEEEELFLKDSKKYKKQRKLKTSQDKSKYKKTDIEKQKNLIIQKDHFEKGLILSISGKDIIASCNGKSYICSLRGSLKKERTKIKNIIAVGDNVDISLKNETEAVIENIRERYNILSRIDEKTKKRSIIAVNVDQVLIVSSILKPSFKPSLIDRYIIASQKEKIKPVILINKIDLLKENREEEEKYLNFIKTYVALGYLILPISCETKIGLDSLLDIMKGKTSVLSGQSGTGKSSIINATLKTKFKTSEVQKKTFKGSHATTMASLVEVKDGGFCIDTPGIKSFGIWDLEIDDIKNYFFEITNLAKNCKYPNCLHLSEPSCYVKKAVETNEISKLRFESYCSLIEEILEKKRKLYE